MTRSSNPRFRMLIGWCCLLSAALLIITVFLATRNSFNKQLNTNTTSKESMQTESITPNSALLMGSLPGQSFKNYIRFIIGKNESWMCEPPCQNSFLSLQNNSVKINVSGFYFINAQIYFKKNQIKSEQIRASQSKQEEKKAMTVILLRNKGRGTSDRKLSEVAHYEEGSVSIIRMVQLRMEDSISLNINPQSMMISAEDFHTYWEIIAL